MGMRVGLVDLGAAVVVLVAIFLPERAYSVTQLVPAEDRGELLRSQSDLASVSDAAVRSVAAERAALLLTEARQHDLALDIAIPVANSAAPGTWRADLGASIVYAERWEYPLAWKHVKEALAKCDKKDSECPAYEKTRLNLLESKLKAAVDAVEEGIDPIRDSDAFRKRVEEGSPTIQFRLTPRY